MKIFQSIEDVSDVKKPVATVGTFDGVHRGHRVILSRLVAEAKRRNTSSVVFTFYPHPRLVLSPDGSDIRLLNTYKQKSALLEEQGVDYLFEIPFTRAFASQSSEEFIKKYLVDALGVSCLIIGHDHHFGKDREGGFGLISKLSERYEFEVCRLEALSINQETLSSTEIRHALRKGELDRANRFLGYPYSISGKVVSGNKNGRKMGFPTANISFDNRFKLIPANGVYAALVVYAGREYRGMANVGFRPTIRDNKYTVEVNIFDFDKQIYGEEIEIRFIHRIRDEVRFSSFETLKIQLQTDKENIVALLGS